jgi:hypothetical protein
MERYTARNNESNKHCDSKHCIKIATPKWNYPNEMKLGRHHYPK